MPGLPLRSPFGTTFDMFTHEGGAEDFSLQNSKKFKGTYQGIHPIPFILHSTSSFFIFVLTHLLVFASDLLPFYSQHGMA